MYQGTKAKKKSMHFPDKDSLKQVYYMIDKAILILNDKTLAEHRFSPRCNEPTLNIGSPVGILAFQFAYVPDNFKISTLSVGEDLEASLRQEKEYLFTKLLKIYKVAIKALGTADSVSKVRREQLEGLNAGLHKTLEKLRDDLGEDASI